MSKRKPRRRRTGRKEQSTDSDYIPDMNQVPDSDEDSALEELLRTSRKRSRKVPPEKERENISGNPTKQQY